MSTPDNAETLGLLDHVKNEHIASRLCPGAQQIKPVLICPGCKKRAPLPRQFQPFTCDCGLTACIEGLSLKVWRDEPVTA